MQARHTPFFFRYRQFFKLWLGQVTSQAGNKIYQIAIVWWILNTYPEHGGFALGAFMVAGALPSLLFCNFIGRVVDRMPAKKMLVGCDLITTCLLTFIGYSLFNNLLDLKQAFLLSFLLATAEGFFNPAVTKCLPSLVDEESLEQAVAYQTSTQYLASFGGSVVGAMLIGWLGIPLLISLTALNYFISAMIELTIQFPEEVHSSEARAESVAAPDMPDASGTPGPVEAPPGQLSNANQGNIDWQRFPLLKSLLVGFGLVNFFATPVLVVIPLYVKNVLHAEASTLGMLEASLWVGILLGTFAASLIKTGHRAIKLGAISMLVYGICMFIPGFFIDAWAFGSALFMAGMSLGINNVKFITLFQKVVDDEIKGRFFAAMQAIIGFSFPIAYLVFGYLGDLLSPDKVCIIQGIGILGVALWFYQLSHREVELHSARPATQ
ncbi:MAG TPA: MFS transporter [Candidatus Rifleibacterium sp.]|nr:MFS transporter [Candidatus Rifleibacterium sp.]HPT44277.1 MFS transporter [Candidatus Rifleibacterium sp.]